jgi:hypothetical protein
MELRIDKGGLIKDTQQKFNAAYPYLKIEFFKPSARQVGKNIFKPEKKGHSDPVSKLDRFSKSGVINIESKQTASQLEHDFLETSGLIIKLYRKSGILWIETTLTENWTLEKQNEEGEFMSAPVVHKNPFRAEAEDEWMEKE